MKMPRIAVLLPVWNDWGCAARLLCELGRELQRCGFVADVLIADDASTVKPPADFAAAQPTAVCDHYVSYLLRTAALAPFPVVLAALLPCFWIYLEVGKHIHARAAKPNPYQAWIDTYAGDEFENAVRAVIATTDEVADRASQDTLESMHTAFTRATQLEWIFWDSAYRLASWPV